MANIKYKLYVFGRLCQIRQKNIYHIATTIIPV